MTIELEALPPAVEQLLTDLAEMDVVFDVHWRRIDELETIIKDLRRWITAPTGAAMQCESYHQLTPSGRRFIAALIEKAKVKP